MAMTLTQMTNNKTDECAYLFAQKRAFIKRQLGELKCFQICTFHIFFGNFNIETLINIRLYIFLRIRLPATYQPTNQPTNHPDQTAIPTNQPQAAVQPVNEKRGLKP
jgi:hypothetical protein